MAKMDKPDEDSQESSISPQALRGILDSLVVIPRWWLGAVSIAVVLSCFTVTRGIGGAYIIRFAVTTTAVALLGIAWLPALIRTIAVVLRRVKIAGVEAGTAGIEELLGLFRSHEPKGVALTSAGLQEDLESSLVDTQSESARAAQPEGHYYAREEWLPSHEYQDGLPAWTEERERLYRDNHNLFLVHQIRPSKTPGQKYDVFVFLAGAHGVQPSEVVEQADFFLGPYWRNEIISAPVRRSEKTIGIHTSSYGPTLCICRIVLKGSPNSEIVLYRFLDFEMHWVFDVTAQELVGG